MIKFIPNIEDSISDILKKVLRKFRNCGRIMQTELRETTQNHFRKIYPNSTHYNPDKVLNYWYSNGESPYASIKINVPGITKAYHSLHILPIDRGALTIPMHQSAYGKPASSFNDLFMLKKKDGKSFLAKPDGNKGITFMYYLAKSIHQNQNKNLMPSDETYGKNIFDKIIATL